MDNFAFIIHPLDVKKDVARKFRSLALLPEQFLQFISRYLPPFYISHITGITSIGTGKEIEGWFVSCAMPPRRMMTVPTQTAYKKIVQAGRLAQGLGAKIIGLGAFTSVVGDAGVTVARQLQMPVTTGNSYTAAVTVQAISRAAESRGVKLDHSSLAVVGASGSIGRACARVLAPRVSEVILVGQSAERLDGPLQDVRRAGAACTRSAVTLDALKDAQLIIATTSARRPIIESRHLSPGTIVCDVARPFNVDDEARTARNDLLVINGGMVKVPGVVNFHFNFGMPPGIAFACMAETMILALEGRFENYTLGRDISLDRVKEIEMLAEKHGFSVQLT